MKEHQQEACSPTVQSCHIRTLGSSDLPVRLAVPTGDNIVQGFKESISRGNAVELVVGAIIDAAFKNAVGALVDGIINPLIVVVIDRSDLSGAFILIPSGIDVKFGVLVFAVISFLFMVITLYLYTIAPVNVPNECMKKRAVADEAEVETSKEESDKVKPLTGICDALAQGTPHH